MKHYLTNLEKKILTSSRHFRGGAKPGAIAAISAAFIAQSANAKSLGLGEVYDDFGLRIAALGEGDVETVRQAYGALLRFLPEMHTRVAEMVPAHIRGDGKSAESMEAIVARALNIAGL